MSFIQKSRFLPAYRFWLGGREWRGSSDIVEGPVRPTDTEDETEWRIFADGGDPFPLLSPPFSAVVLAFFATRLLVEKVGQVHILPNLEHSDIQALTVRYCLLIFAVFVLVLE